MMNLICIYNFLLCVLLLAPIFMETCNSHRHFASGNDKSSFISYVVGSSLKAIISSLDFLW